MPTVRLPEIGTAKAWRDAARACLRRRLLPEDVLWRYGDAAPDLFAGPAAMPGAPTGVTVPAAFVALADAVVWHRDPERFARLYALLWRVAGRPAVMGDGGDPAVARLRAMEKAVHRCQEKMRAFVRFREIGGPDDARRRFAAWFEPTHHTVEPTAPFFARRFADMDWRIVTPDRSAVFEDGALRFEAGRPKPPLPEDAAEELWATYFRSIFNPARLKVAAMRSGMPKKYWRNLPEAQSIPDLIAQAEARVDAMRQAAPTAPPPRAARAAGPAKPGGDPDG